jgi:hypothetical protein
MKYQITPEDQTIMDRDMQSNRTLKHLKNKSIYKFSVGDVLLREDKYGADWKVQLADCGLPYKYVYVFENELSIGYIRRLSINGSKFVGAPTCVLEFDPTYTRFQPDPEYADHILLGSEDEEFDAQTRYLNLKKKREQINRKNKKARIQMNCLEDAIAWMKSLKVGDTFYYGNSIGHIHKDVYYVTKVDIDIDPNRCNIMYSVNPNFQGYRMNAYNAQHYSIFKDKPFYADEIVN